MITLCVEMIMGDDQLRRSPSHAAVLRTDNEIRATGAAAVEGWRLTDEQVNRLVAICGPVFMRDIAVAEQLGWPLTRVFEPMGDHRGR